MAPQLTWRGEFTSTGANALHAQAFGTRVFGDDERDWAERVQRHGLGWVTARDAGRLVGFVDVVWDGLAHALLQDLMVASDHRHRGIGRQLVDVATDGAREAGCDWLHVDLGADLAAFYLGTCGFTRTSAGLKALR